ncbi:solute carrier family 49 member A3-like [Ptychodera flava]|uniref:solute carrier family 49 member A3-like n=1 Tax=Ptychodera flava TaxID=63121 RepID=UPI00396AAB82
MEYDPLDVHSEQLLRGEAKRQEVPINIAVGGGFTVYKRRWFVLFVVALHAASAQMIWLSFSPVATEAAKFYNVPVSRINLFSLMFLILSIPMGFVAAWLLDTYGLRPGILLASWVNTIGGVVRIISTLDFVPKSHAFSVAMAGQVIAATVYPVFTSCPTKVANKWFGENQRSVATMIGTFPLGYLLANLLSPLLIKKEPPGMGGIEFMLIIICVPSAFGTLLATFGLCNSLPPTPPSRAAERQDEPFWTGFKEILKIRSFWILMVLCGCGVGLFNAVSLLLEQILCPHGYTPTFAGICGALIIGVGFIGAVTASIILDRTKMYDEICKVMLCLGSIAMSFLAAVGSISDKKVSVAVGSAITGFFLCGSYPIVLELAVEATYPIAQATSTGLILISGHIQGIAYTFAMQALGRPLPDHLVDVQQCNKGNQTVTFYAEDTNSDLPDDMTWSMLFAAGLMSLTVISFTLLFSTEYKRRNTENALNYSRLTL